MNSEKTQTRPSFNKDELIRNLIDVLRIGRKPTSDSKKITKFKIIFNKLRFYSFRLNEFRYNANESFLRLLGLRSTYLAQVYNTQPDLAMQKWKDFAGKVTSFGECDGYAKIITTTEKSYLEMPEGWFYHPPTHFLLIEEDGSIVDLWQKDKQDREKPISEDDEAYQDDYDARVFWTIDARAGLISLHSQLSVRTGFWTRIVSPNLSAALNKTFELWDLENRLPESVKNNKIEDPRCNRSKEFLDLWRAEDSIYHLDKYEDVFGPYIASFKKEFSVEDWYRFWELLNDKKEDILKLEKTSKKELKKYEPTFDSYKNQLKVLRTKYKKARKTNKSVEFAFKFYNEQDKLFDEMIKGLEKKNEQRSKKKARRN